MVDVVAVRDVKSTICSVVGTKEQAKLNGLLF
jgi:hypothetical protein